LTQNADDCSDQIEEADQPQLGISFEAHTVHQGCATWASDSHIRVLADPRELMKLTGDCWPGG